METILELSKILNTGLDAKTLSICVQLCELGIHPESIATAIREIKTEFAQLSRNASKGDNIQHGK